MKGCSFCESSEEHSSLVNCVDYLLAYIRKEEVQKLEMIKIIANEEIVACDYFAAKAMQGLIAASGNTRGDAEFCINTVVENAYLVANAMLEERSKAKDGRTNS